MVDNKYRFGIEEEYFLADASSRSTPSSLVARRFHAIARTHFGASHEVLQSQVEVSTPPGTDFATAREQLLALRAGLAAIGREMGLLVFAAGTHPLARWSDQTISEGERYARMLAEYGILAARNLVCALHVHVEVPDPGRRVDLMRRMLPYMPIFLALSASSPFWQGQRTGLAAYRMAAYREWPRSGLPDLLENQEDYDHFLRAMIGSGAIPDASYLWWTLRPSMRFPTLELRVCDSCMRVEDSLTIAALYRCLLRLLDRRPDIHARLTGVSRAIANENFWLVQREGIHASLIDAEACTRVTLVQRLQDLAGLVAEDAAALGCEREVAGLDRIVTTGTGADQQIATYEHGRRHGLDNEAALRDVVDALAATSR
ncbi:putative glutamate--cysteine ligase 2 [Rhodovastum atsumiense]|uniref:Putative glutamate--cysteine ligase 2 n=1 Tax=Rhodovastum atsumiense TaxID=504468 RepID=A0A5M6IT36_9PROT|nr:carboxylate-amine ligase [Rhodovastum atsumiense]KAA5611484.1 carboxylate-amine ligase [Rhodovastum atsumiense]CAH2601177.1 putative glutamate--cysteine ligase 2 [Rhodovastum atsumiense]